MYHPLSFHFITVTVHAKHSVVVKSRLPDCKSLVLRQPLISSGSAACSCKSVEEDRHVGRVGVNLVVLVKVCE